MNKIKPQIRPFEETPWGGTKISEMYGKELGLEPGQKVGEVIFDMRRIEPYYNNTIKDTNMSQEKEESKEELTGKFEKFAAEIGKVVDEKNKAYGNSFAEAGEFLKILYPSGIPLESYNDALTLTRIFDKLKRIATNNDPFGEDPFFDIAGYAILGAYNNKRLKEEKKQRLQAALAHLEKQTKDV